jgi:D-serine deaminase-like pyridoxal phosphate-dependent protein
VIVDRIALKKRLDRATARLETPIAAVDLAAFDDNAAELVKRAGGKPLRVASKSVRCRALLERVLATPGWHGVMASTLPEAVWLVREGVTDDPGRVPDSRRTAIGALTTDPKRPRPSP